MFHTEHHSTKNAGFSLLAGSVLLFSTMILHPSHLQEGYEIINILSHSLAILSIPFLLYGFWGLSYVVRAAGFLSNIGFAFAVLGLIAAMLAAAINGIAATLFYESQASEPAEIASSILHYSFALNNAVSYIFIGGILVALLFLSISIVKTRELAAWTGYLGLLVVAAGIVFPFLTNAMQVGSFRIFIFGIVGWIVLISVMLMTLKTTYHRQDK